MKLPSEITVTMIHMEGPFPWHGHIKIEYERTGAVERFMIRGHTPVNVIRRCGDSIERKLKQNESKAVA